MTPTRRTPRRRLLTIVLTSVYLSLMALVGVVMIFALQPFGQRLWTLGGILTALCCVAWGRPGSGHSIRDVARRRNGPSASIRPDEEGDRRRPGRLGRARRLVGPEPRRGDAASEGRPGRRPGADVEHPARVRGRPALDVARLVGTQAGPPDGPQGRCAGHPLRAGGPRRAGEVPGGGAAGPSPGRGRPG